MSKETILVVDDNSKIVDFLANHLLPDLGYQTRSAYDGRTALMFIRTFKPDLVLLDLELPDMTGLDILRALKQQGLQVPTILITAHGSEQVAVDAFRLGVHDYLIKPIDADNLNAAIARALTVTRLRHETNRLTNILKEQISWLTVLSRIGQSVTSTLQIDEVLRRIVEAGVHLTRADEGFLALLDPSNDRLYLRAVKNIDQEKTQNLRLPVNDSLVGSVLREKKPVRITQGNEAQKLKVSTGFLVHSLIHVPILSRGSALGVLSVDNQSFKKQFTERDETLLASLADYAAVAIENARLYQRAQQEIMERLRIEKALRESEERYALAVQGANDGLWDWDLISNHIYFSERWKAMLGIADQETGSSPDEWFNRVHPDDRDRLKAEITAHLKGGSSHFENEHRMLHQDGTYRWMLSRGLAVWDQNQNATRIAGSQTDVTERKYTEQKLLQDAFYDRLTGLANRSLFMDRLKHAIEMTKRRSEGGFAVLFLDLDRFKDVNDSLGHLAGDQLLQAVSQMLNNGVRSSDTVARLGGDEFVLLLEGITDLSAATRVAEWILEQLAAPFQIMEHAVFISASIGIILSPTGYARPEDILRDADIAMYAAKALGKSRYEIFDPTMRVRIMTRLELEGDLRQALKQGQFRVYYQPIVSLRDGSLTGFEALVRWMHPQRGLLLPNEFIPLAEETGLVIPIDRWVLFEACQQMRAWQQEIPDLPPITISVNLSGKQIAQKDLMSQIQKILQETGLPASSLKLEITESAILDNNEATSEVFKQLRALGINVQIDDFGTGYSSLGYLQQYAVNALKIDRAFVNRIKENGTGPEIVQTVIMLAHDLGLEAVAEGMETEEQFKQLKALGCEYAQGFLVSQAVDGASAEKMLLDYINGGRSKIPWKKRGD